MKGFIYITTILEEQILINTSKIRVVNKTDTGCTISLDDHRVPSALRGNIQKSHSYYADINYIYANKTIETALSFAEVCSLIELAQK